MQRSNSRWPSWPARWMTALLLSLPATSWAQAPQPQDPPPETRSLVLQAGQPGPWTGVLSPRRREAMIKAALAALEQTERDLVQCRVAASHQVQTVAAAVPSCPPCPPPPSPWPDRALGAAAGAAGVSLLVGALALVLAGR